MPPRKRKAEEGLPEEKPAAAVALPRRVTRSAARKASEPADPPAALPEKMKKKEKKKKEDPKKGARAKKEEAENGNGVPEIINGETEKATTKTIVIEHCKQCNSFKRRAEEAKAGLTKAISGIMVVFNPDKPRRGCFEIREDGGEKFVTLVDMKRPFKPMKDLDMNKVVEGIVKKIKC